MPIKKFALLIIFMCPVFIKAQAGLELVHADKNVGREINGEQIHIFLGDVFFRQDTLDMFCEKATLYEKQDKLEFLGNVLMTDGKRQIRARRIEYFIETEDAFCYDSVRIKSEKDSLYAEFVQYNFNTDNALAEKKLYIRDIENIVEIWGDEGTYNAEIKHSSVKRFARLTKIDSASQDTLFITAHKLDYYGGDEPRALAVDSVTIIQGKLTASCDSAIYYTESEVVTLNINPYAWYEESELNGIQIEASFDSLDLKKITVTGNAKANSLADSVQKKYNELKGKIIYFDIMDDEPKQITAIENASSIYYLKDEKKDQGSNFATSDTIMVFFSEGEMDSISIIGGSEGVFYPNDYKGKKVFENDQ